MNTLLCVTGNADKFAIGKQAFAKYETVLEQTVAEIDEIQGEDAEVIIRDKARKAYDAIGKPLIVTDDSWSIPALNGFPGPYMKSINHWFTPQDFLNLTKDLSDRSILLIQFIAYQDEKETVIFRKDLSGTLLTEARGKAGAPAMKVVSMDFDLEGCSIAEMYDKGLRKNPSIEGDAWHQAAKWYAETHSA